MGDDEEYYFEDEPYNDEGYNEEEVTWETEVENTYANAKSIMDSDPSGAAKGFQQVVRDDQDHGRWTFKAYKQLTRTYQKAKQFDLMLEWYQKVLTFNYKDRTRNDLEKAINKFIDRLPAIDSALQMTIFKMTLNEIEKDKKNFEKLWFNVKMKLAQISFDIRDFDGLKRELEELEAWCREGENAEIRKGTQLLTVISLEIQMHTETNNLQRLRELYNAANSVRSVILPPKQMGIIRECGGKMYMRQSLWAEAYDAFFQAFRAFDEAGHPRRIACLKYLVLATMLSASKINPFDTNEAKSYQNDPEIVAMTELINAGQKNDITAFTRVLKDKKNARAIMEDTFLYSYLGPLIRKIRCQVLLVLTKPYRSIRLAYIAQELMIDGKEAEALVVSMVLDGTLKGRIDQIQGVVKLERSEEGGAERYAHLNRWVGQLQGANDGLLSRTANLVL